MAAPAILDADMVTLGRWLRAGYGWWSAELRAMLPQGLGRWVGNRRGGGIVARYSGESGFSLYRHGQPMAESEGPAASRPLPVTIVLPGDLALVREAAYPASDERDLKLIALLDADRLLPLPEGSAFHDALVERSAADAPRRAVRIGAVRRSDALQAIEAAEAGRLVPRALGVESGDPARPVMFDFLAQARQALGVRVDYRAARFWWSVVAILFVANLILLVLRDVQSVTAMRDLVAEQAQATGAARTIGQRIAQEAQRRARIAERRNSRDPLIALARATELVPDGAWVQRYDWGGDTLRLAGYRHADVDVLAALRADPMFAEARATGGGTDLPTDVKAGRPFDISVDLGESK